MAVERVRLPLHLVDRIGQALGGGRRGDPPGDALIALGRAELGGEVLVAAHAFARHPGIEEIGVVAHLDRNVGFQRQGLLKPALSDEAPGADDVRNDVDGDRRDGLLGLSDMRGLVCWPCRLKSRRYSAATGRGAMRASKVSAVSPGLSVASVTDGLMPGAVARPQHGVLEHAREPPRRHMGVAQAGVAEHEQDRAVVLAAGEIGVADQPADQARRIHAGAAVERLVEGKARQRERGAAFAGVLDRRARAPGRTRRRSTARSGRRSCPCARSSSAAA